MHRLKMTKRTHAEQNILQLLVLRTLWGALWLAGAACAQNTLDNPDWVEEATPTPPSFSKDKLIPIDMPSYLSVKVGIDPETLTVGGDGVVRYVVVMVNTSGTVNAAFEGIRCVSDEVKTYARVGSSGTWSVLPNQQWKPVNDNSATKHSHVITRQGACIARGTSSKEETLKALQQKQKTSLKPTIN